MEWNGFKRMKEEQTRQAMVFFQRSKACASISCLSFRANNYTKRTSVDSSDHCHVGET